MDLRTSVAAQDWQLLFGGVYFIGYLLSDASSIKKGNGRGFHCLNWLIIFFLSLVRILGKQARISALIPFCAFALAAPF